MSIVGSLLLPCLPSELCFLSAHRFVTLDTTSRDDMMSVMLDLRSKSLKGEPVKARLKSASTAATSPFAPRSAMTAFDPNALAFPAPPVSPPRKQPNLKPKKQQQSKNLSNPRGSRARRKTSVTTTTTKQQPQQPPSSPKKADPPTPPKLQEESHFPALVDPPVAVDNIAEKVGQTMKSSDAASTTTTTSSTTSSSDRMGGYAAALLKAPVPTAASTTTTTATNTTTASTKNTTATKASNFVAYGYRAGVTIVSVCSTIIPWVHCILYCVLSDPHGL